MSLKTRFGNLGNILDFNNLTQEDIFVLDSPILTNSQLKKFKKLFSRKVKIIDCTFNINETLKDNLKRVQEETEIAVREGSTALILSDKNISDKRANIPMALSVGAINSNLVNLLKSKILPRFPNLVFKLITLFSLRESIGGFVT